MIFLCISWTFFSIFENLLMEHCWVSVYIITLHTSLYLVNVIWLFLGLDIVIGPDQANFGSYARITLPGLVEYARDIFADPRMIAMLGLLYVRSSNSIAAKLRIHPSWIPLNYVSFLPRYRFAKIFYYELV